MEQGFYNISSMSIQHMKEIMSHSLTDSSSSSNNTFVLPITHKIQVDNNNSLPWQKTFFDLSSTPYPFFIANNNNDLNIIKHLIKSSFIKPVYQNTSTDYEFLDFKVNKENFFDVFFDYSNLIKKQVLNNTFTKKIFFINFLFDEIFLKEYLQHYSSNYLLIQENQNPSNHFQYFLQELVKYHKKASLFSEKTYDLIEKKIETLKFSNNNNDAIFNFKDDSEFANFIDMNMLVTSLIPPTLGFNCLESAYGDKSPNNYHNNSLYSPYIQATRVDSSNETISFGNFSKEEITHFYKQHNDLFIDTAIKLWMKSPYISSFNLTQSLYFLDDSKFDNKTIIEKVQSSLALHVPLKSINQFYKDIYSKPVIVESIQKNFTSACSFILMLKELNPQAFHKYFIPAMEKKINMDNVLLNEQLFLQILSPAELEQHKSLLEKKVPSLYATQLSVNDFFEEQITISKTYVLELYELFKKVPNLNSLSNNANAFNNSFIELFGILKIDINTKFIFKTEVQNKKEKTIIDKLSISLNSTPENSLFIDNKFFKFILKKFIDNTDILMKSHSVEYEHLLREIILHYKLQEDLNNNSKFSSKKAKI